MKSRVLAAMIVGGALSALIASLLFVVVLGASPPPDNPLYGANIARRPRLGVPGAYPSPVVYPLPVLDTPLVSAVNGYTVTLYAGYANANRVVLRYTLQSAFVEFCNVNLCDTLPGQEPPCRVFDPAAPTPTPVPLSTMDEVERVLTTGDGSTFRAAADTYFGSGDNPTDTTIVFDTPHPAGNVPAELKLHLALPYAEFRIPSEGGGATIRSIRGPFAFDFTLPVDPVRRIADLNQTATASRGDTITIEQVVATWHDVRVTWRASKSAQPPATPIASPPWDRFYSCCDLMLEVGGKATTFGETSLQPEGGLVITDAAVFDVQGDLAISAWYYSTWTGDRADPPLPGPVFRFTMPPAVTSPQK